MHRIRVLRVSGPRAGAAQALASALAASDVDVRVVAAVEPETEVPSGLARRLEPLSVATPVGPVAVTYYEGRSPGGGVDVALAECDPQTLGAFALELCRRTEHWPHVVHASADAAAVVALAKRAPIAPVAVIDLTDESNALPLDAEPLKRALAAADRIAVGSRELAKQNAAGNGALAQFSERVCGIAPGIDPTRWNPRLDPNVPARFSSSDLAGKAECKRELQFELGLAVRSRTPVLGVLGSAPLLTAERAKAIAKMRCQIARDQDDEQLRHQIVAGADFVLVAGPLSCDGYHPLFFMGYGAIPIAPRGSGFAETLVDVDRPSGSGNAFLFSPDGEGLVSAVRRAVSSFSSPGHASMVTRAMTQDLSWETTALRFQELYRTALLA